LEEMVEEGGVAKRVRELKLLTAGEREQLVKGWNRTERELPGKTVVGLLREEARRRPAAVAVEYEGEELSYGELERRGNQLGRYLRRVGVVLETRVGVSLERSLEMVVALVGVLKAGGAYVPLDTGYPAERLRYMVEDAAVKVVVGREEQMQGLIEDGDEGKFRCVDLEQELEEIARESGEELEEISGVRNLGYVMYTSGTTGKPKGIGVEQEAMVRLVKSTDYVELGEQEVMLQYAPIAFDASTFEIWGARLNGGRLVVARRGRLGVEEVVEVIEQRGVSTAWLTGSLLNAVVEGGVEGLKGMRQLLAGGEVLSAKHVKKVVEGVAGVKVINGYGPTENTTFSCCHEVRKEELEGGGSIAIGKPIGNTQAYVLDEEMEPVPVGVKGELYVGGKGVARGYENRAELTAERFVPNPFVGGEGGGGGRLYRTGDQVRWRREGKLEYLGRKDQQVKIRGYRIELEEIEGALQECEGVKQAVVLVEEGEGESRGENKRLVGYVVGEERGRELEVEQVRSELRKKVPGYMVPSEYVEVEELPLTENGKVDRKKVEREGRKQGRVVGAGEGEWGKRGRRRAGEGMGAEEEILVGVYEEVLKREGVGEEESFFE